MKFEQRLYHDRQDLYAVATLLRETYQKDPSWNAWSCFRYDIWAQRRVGDELVFGKTGWQKDFFLWEDSTGRLGGALFYDQNIAVIICLPEFFDLYAEILAQAELHSAQMGSAKNPLAVELLESNPVNALRELFETRGFRKEDGYMICREKQLENTAFEPVLLPPGYRLKTLQTDEELAKFFGAVKAVFNFQDDPAVYRLVQQAPSFSPDLDLLILSEQGEVASFCTVWVDKALGYAEFEPVGTVEAFRQLGLGKAILTEAFNRLRRVGCPLVTVASYSGADPANALYSSAGLEPVDKLYTWQKTFIN
ncbi:MAG: GNAT family N-acetyltransferase [Chloroflexi bacterium]|nr:GNAT family N-acetyltransferase [Chloroflexota bacterium]OJV89151.1 MAG: hypothetical protein BGO39_34630 [Chloroflexi bacterium 54-19]